MSTEIVTIEKAYFETLLRRAQLHTSGIDFNTVTIPKHDHDSLLNTAREYANLRRNLYKGGIGEETLSVLINDDGPTSFDANDTLTSVDASESAAFQTQQLAETPQLTFASRSTAQDYTYGRNDHHNGRSGHTNGYSHSNVWDDYSTTPRGQVDVYYEATNGMRSQNQNRRPQFAKQCQRTILLPNLPDGTTHADVAEVVKGGMLLDIYFRNDRGCSISFLEEEHARNFFHYAKRNDLYVRGKRVEVKWHDRQFILPGHVANKVGIGATRNLVIRNASPKHTEEMIREDLEHIHNLVVISVRVTGASVHISTNSVHNAMFARTCMMSRGAYKASKIDWDVDDCAENLPKSQKTIPKESVQPKKPAPIANRFELLNIDGAEESSVDGEQDTGFQTNLFSSVGVAV